ncbi:hypothetical protein Taro_026400 [Colocasia esculenta]|uniref:Uncharacterized protein n=1 Tax=Colocasia esculenta TaxID=4460 RepID=A0A843VKI2_COLES|nr:hypothetical protein [Colocasia esculenta]
MSTLQATAHPPTQAAALLSSFPHPDVQLKHRSEGVQEDDTNLNGTTLYRDKPRAQQTHLTYTITYINHINNNTTTCHWSQSDSEGYTKH